MSDEYAYAQQAAAATLLRQAEANQLRALNNRLLRDNAALCVALADRDSNLAQARVDLHTATTALVAALDELTELRRQLTAERERAPHLNEA